MNVITIVFSIILSTLFLNPNYNSTNGINAIVNIDYKNTNENNLEENESYEWKLEIPKIELSAEIAEGTSENILNEYIGHFESTNKKDGNIALAAHNRGYKVNYFERLKELEIGDKVIYKFQGFTKIYEISSKNIIKDTNVEVLEKTDENILTFITCVENEPSLRRCLIAKEIKNKEGN